jgi:hypothetical protein
MISSPNRGVRVMLYSDRSGNTLMLDSSPVRGTSANSYSEPCDPARPQLYLPYPDDSALLARNS